MHKKDSEDGKRAGRRGLLLIAVGLGIALFVTGFVLAVTSLSDPESVSASGGRESSIEDDRASSLSLLVGLMLSLSGVVLATATPAVFFIRSQKGTG